jgi:predicted PurR-regulated permease PerM
LARGPFTLDLFELEFAPLLRQALEYVQPALRQASALIAGLAGIALEGVAKMLFVIAVAYFFTLDQARIRRAWENISLPGYQGDMARLRTAMGRIWDSFLRGQLLIVLISGLLTWALMSLLGVRFALGLGVLGGVAKFVPILGPSLAGALAVLVALFQPSNWLGLSPLAHAALVGLSMTVVNQALDYLLVPRVMGSSLNLHPVVVLVGAILGAALAGLLGLLLSAPAVASGILIGRYIYRKMTDQSPWDPPIDAAHQAPPPAALHVLRRRLVSMRGMERREKRASQPLPTAEEAAHGLETPGRDR